MDDGPRHGPLRLYRAGMTGEHGSGLPPSEEPSVADVVLGWLLFAVAAAVASVVSMLGLMLPLGLDACDECTSEERFVAGWVLAVVGPWPPLAGAVVTMILQMSRGRLICWIPLAALAAGIALSTLGWAVAYV